MRRNAVIIILLLALLIPAGCAKENTPKGDGLKIVTTIFPVYDWARCVCEGTDADISYLTDNGADLHSYQLTFGDLAEIADCDLFVYIGGASDSWTEAETIEKSDCRKLKITGLSGITLYNEELKEGMEPEEDGEEGAVKDEHIWFSTDNARAAVNGLAEVLSQLDAENAGLYEENARSFCEKAAIIDGNYRDTVSAAACKTLLFGDRFPFIYLTKSYGLDYYAPFPGCSADSEASFETIAFLQEKAEELKSEYIIITKGASDKTARTIMSGNEKYKIIELDSMQQVTLEEAKSETYLSIMESNLEKLRTILGTD